MSDNVFKQAFAQHEGLQDERARHNTKIVIISIDEEKQEAWCNTPFWRSMLMEGIQPSSRLIRVVTSRHTAS
jgi:hypothetical protein